MDQVRGVVLIVLGVLALCRGWTLHTGRTAWLAFALGAVSLALGAWRMTQKSSRPPG